MTSTWDIYHPHSHPSFKSALELTLCPNQTQTIHSKGSKISCPLGYCSFCIAYRSGPIPFHYLVCGAMSSSNSGMILCLHSIIFPLMQWVHSLFHFEPIRCWLLIVVEVFFGGRGATDYSRSSNYYAVTSFSFLCSTVAPWWERDQDLGSCKWVKLVALRGGICSAESASKYEMQNNCLIEVVKFGFILLS